MVIKITPEERELIVGLTIQGKTPEEISEELELSIADVSGYIKERDKMSGIVPFTKDNRLQDLKDKLRKDFDIMENISYIVTKVKSLLTQIEDDGIDINTGKSKVKPAMMYPYLTAISQFTELNKWMVDRRIKMEEMIENQIYKQALLEELRNESPEFAARVMTRIEKLKQENALFS